MRAHCGRARAIGTRIFRSPRGSSHPRHRAPILAFYNFVRTADDIADHATLAAAGEARAARSPRCRPAPAMTMPMRPRCAARGAGRAQAVAAARAGSARRLPARRHQAALSRLGRSDAIIAAIGDAGRPLRARRARREPRHLAGQRRAVRGAADHQSSAGLRGGLSQSRPRLCSAGRARGVRDGCRGARRAARVAAAARLPARGSPNAPSGCLARAMSSPP